MGWVGWKMDAPPIRKLREGYEAPFARRTDQYVPVLPFGGSDEYGIQERAHRGIVTRIPI
jgi:hypothetical protein